MLFSILILMCSISCNEDNGSEVLEPANLTVEVDISEDRSGNVDITALADNTIEYEFDLGEINSEIITSTTGILTHQYAITGLYEIEVKAIGTSGRFVRKTIEISVQVGDPTLPVDPGNGYSTPLEYPGMTLIWQDEFSGSSLNETDWNFEIGRGSNGWGNNELQYYRKENTTVTDGLLTIEAKKEEFSGAAYTSSRLTTQGKFDFKYGRVDIRAALPKGQGIWPALWMLGSNISSVGWPACGETDIMEMIGGGEGRDDKTHGTIHWDDNGTKRDVGGSVQLAEGIFNDEFHVFTIIWDEDEIKWFLDDELFFTTEITDPNRSEFRDEFFFIFNVAVGGNWPGSPNSSTVFPQKMIVDYVRVFQ